MPTIFILKAARTALLLIGLATFLWSICCMSGAWQSAVFESIAARIISGEVFFEGALDRSLHAPDGLAVLNFDLPRYTRAIAITRLRYVEEMMAVAETQKLELVREAFRKARNLSLSMTPSDPFIWLVFFGLETGENGYSRDYVKYLEYSYELGPREQWIAERRNRLAVTVFADLRPETQKMVIAEFAGLVESNSIKVAADTLVGPGWSIRDKLLAGISNIGLAQKAALSRHLSGAGFANLIPGFAEFEGRPWKN